MKYVGDVFKTNNYGDCIVLNYEGSSKVTVKFKNTGSIKTVKLCHLKDGNVKDNFAITVYGEGYLGEGFDLGNKKLNEKAFKLWSHMLERCYSEKYKHSRPTYLNCHSSDNFKNLTFFKKWCVRQQGFNEDGFMLDKDILVKGNKMYSEDTCCFVPQEVNKIFTNIKNTNSGLVGANKQSSGKYSAAVKHKGKIYYLGSYATEVAAFEVYKETKEKFVREVAREYKDIIDLRVYNALMNYKVQINN